MNRDEESNLFKAGSWKFQGSTFERKQMSTTIKRVALVAVASLGLGVIGAGSSVAAPSAAYTTMVDTTLGQQEVGGQATVTVTIDSNTVTNIAVSGVGSVLAATPATAVLKSGSIASGSWSDSATSNVANGTDVLILTSSVVGTQTITMTPLNADGTLGTAVTKSVTWVTTASKNTYDHATAFIAAGNVSGRVIADSTTAELSLDSTISTSAERATISVMQFSPVDTTTVSNLVGGKGKAIVATISGAGILGKAADTPSGASVTYSTNTTTNTDDKFYVFSDGRVGPATITISVNGVTIATKTVNFFGALASYKQNADAPLSANYIAASGTATVTIDGADAAGVKQASGTIYATSDTTTVATVAVSGSVVTVTGVAVGKTNINVCNTSACTSATVKYSFPIEVTKTTAATVAVAFDAASYGPGEKMTITVTATDSNGRPVADGARLLFADTFTANVAITGSLPAQAPVLVNGKATYVAYAPAGSGSLVVSGKEGTATDSTTKATVSASATVSNPGVDAATDAANEAAQAASDATDAALAAADAADAATTKAQEAVDAVATLSAQVSKLITALKAQITTLTNLVIKIQKKVKA
jgi:hypothetical protein